MPQTRTITQTVYQFDELSDKAKERAREWYREGLVELEDLSDRNYEDFVECANRIGIDFNQKETGQRRDGTKVYGPAIYWSGFCSQGDGACFEGTYDYKADASAKIRDHAPQDKELHRIADELTAIQARNAFGLHATIEHTGRYYHKHSTTIDVVDKRNEDRKVEDEDAVAELMRDFMQWMYRQLEADNDYLNSDEAVDESIEANEYEFDEEGERI